MEMSFRVFSSWCLVLAFCTYGVAARTNSGNLVFNVKKFGAKGDGQTDDSKVCAI
jgi:polygalacturonase